MSNAEEPKLSPEAIKMLNDLASERAEKAELSPEARENLAKLGNHHLTQTYKAYKNSYLLMAAVFSAIAVGAILYLVNDLLAHPNEVGDILFALPAIGGFAAIIGFIALKMFKTYTRL